MMSKTTSKSYKGGQVLGLLLSDRETYLEKNHYTPRSKNAIASMLQVKKHLYGVEL